MFPGHTYLQTDTQIYVPMMERIYNPVLFSNDPMVQHSHLALTAYDEIVIALRNYTGLDFEAGLKLLQLVFRACAAAGLLLIALRLGLTLPAAFFVTSALILNQGTLGTAITELEPVARSFAMGLLLLGVGLALHEHFLAAGLLGALGFLIHPTTMGPFWCVAAVAVLLRVARPVLLAPLVPACGLLWLMSHFQTGGTESISFFRTLDPFQLDLQKRYMGLSYVEEWDIKRVLDCLSECAVAAAAFWRLRDRLQSPLREWLGGLGVIGVLSVPFSWIVADRLHWAMAGPWDPMRALAFVTLLAALLSGACGVFAAEKRIWWEAAVWFGIVISLPVKELLVTRLVNPWLIALVLALVAASTIAAWFQSWSPYGVRGPSLVAAGVLLFVAFPVSGLIPPAKLVDTPELRQLARWAQTTTDETAVFLFADDGLYGGSGPFRARALRSIYVDYEGRALVNYFREYSAEWMRRWRDVHEGYWPVRDRDFKDLAERKIDFVVLRKANAIPGRQPEFSNSRYSVYRVRSVF